VCDEVAVGLRYFVVGSYVVFYRVENQIEIARILHGAQDFEPFFRPNL